jgi:hypothetical protein
MTYFKPKSFLLSLRNKLLNDFEMDQVSTEREPLMYKISGSSALDFVHLTFEVVDGKVEVALKFDVGASDDFVTKVSDAIQELLVSEYGDEVKKKSY